MCDAKNFLYTSRITHHPSLITFAHDIEARSRARNSHRGSAETRPTQTGLSRFQLPRLPVALVWRIHFERRHVDAGDGAELADSATDQSSALSWTEYFSCHRADPTLFADRRCGGRSRRSAADSAHFTVAATN